MVAVGVAIGEAMGNGTIKDDGEIDTLSTPSCSHTDLELYPTSYVLGAISSIDLRARRLAASYPRPKGSLTAVASNDLRDVLSVIFGLSVTQDTELCVFLLDFKLLDENRVLLRVPRKDNMYSVDLKNIVPSGGLTCLFAKATLDESNLWHRRLGHINFKTLNKLVRGNLVRDLKVKVIRCDNGTEFKNKVMNQFCEMKGIKREFSVARTPQQNRVAERKNRTLIEAARTMLADSKLPTTFWAEAVNTACYVQNRVTTYLKFDGKADEGFFVGYSTNSKAYRVFNSRTRIVEVNMHVKFSEETPNISRNGPN
ncbi:ribonuclease H-like domain-containing protein [Tanacetum coccineum]